MSVSLRKQFNIGNWLNEYARQKKLALCMWYDIIIALQHEDDVKIGDKKGFFAKKHNLHWQHNCFLCQLFMSKDSCTECPLNKKYIDQARYGCSAEDHITAYARVVDFYLPKEERIAAAWEIVEAIKSV